MFPRIARSLAAFSLAAMLLGGWARADVTVRQQVEGEGLRGEMLIRVSGNQGRADLPQQVSILIDGATGVTTYLRRQSKTYTQVTPSEADAFAEKLKKEQAALPPPKLETTAQKKKILGHEAHLFLWSVGALKISFWVAEDYPNGEAIQRQLDLMQTGGLGGLAAGLMPNPEQLPGVRLATEIDLEGQKISYTVLAIDEAPVLPQTFVIPKDYQKGPAPDRSP